MKTGKLIAGLAVLLLAQQALAYRYGGGNSVYIRTTPTEHELRVQEEIKIREDERKQRAAEEKEIDRIGREMAKTGHSFVGGRPQSVSEANAQYARAMHEQRLTDSICDEAQFRQSLQNARFRQIQAMGRVPHGRVFGVKSGSQTESGANTCPKCDKGRVKCPSCNGTRLISTTGGSGCAPCTNCTDGSVPCNDCAGKGVAK